MEKKQSFTIINQQNGNLAFKLFYFEESNQFDHFQRNHFYSLIWIQKGNGLLKVDFSEYIFEGGHLFAFAPFQPFMFSTDQPFSGIAIQFHSDFYCIYRNPKETNCDNVLFNNVFEKPFIQIDNKTQDKFNIIIDQIIIEFNDHNGENYDLFIPYLKILLITASRLKDREKTQKSEFIKSETPYILKNFKSELEINFKEKHSASDYASLLHISSNALAKLVKTHFNKTLTELISERIIIEAKRELYLSNKTVKEIAWDLGYKDEFHFSKFFKNNTDISPQYYRDTVGFGKAKQNY